MVDKSWRNERLSDLSPRAQQALKNKLEASKLASEANKAWIAVLADDYGPLPEGKRFAVNLNLKFQNIGLKIVDAEVEVVKKVKAPKQSFDEWKKEQLANGHDH